MKGVASHDKSSRVSASHRSLSHWPIVVSCQVIPRTTISLFFYLQRKRILFPRLVRVQSDHVSLNGLLFDFHGHFWDSNESPNALPGQYSFDVADFYWSRSLWNRSGFGPRLPRFGVYNNKEMNRWIWELRCLEGWFESKEVIRKVYSSMQSIDLGVARKLLLCMYVCVYTFKHRLTVHRSL